MNCVGKSNYGYFIGMLLSLAILLTYGGYIAHIILTDHLQKEVLKLDQNESIKQSWSSGLSWERYVDLWLWAISKDIRIGGVGMLATLTAPLAWGMLLYHAYLIWAGMTTNESSKWADLKEDIADGFVFQSYRRSEDTNGPSTGTPLGPIVKWPKSNDQWLVRCDDGKSPDDEVEVYDNTILTRPMPRWKRLRSLSEVHNLYDLGFWGNLADIIST